MAGAAFWGGTDGVTGGLFPSDEPWDTATLAGIPLPGICEVRGIAQLEIDKNIGGASKGGLDVKKAVGRDGATITVTGYQPGPFEIACTVWTDGQWQNLQKIIDKLWTKPKKKAKVKDVAVDVDHPALQMLGIKSAVIQGITFPEEGGITGARVVRFKMFENVPPGKKKAVKTVKSSGAQIVPPLIKGEEPLNYTPARPSADPKNLGPAGQPAPPHGGSS